MSSGLQWGLANAISHRDISDWIWGLELHVAQISPNLALLPVLDTGLSKSQTRLLCIHMLAKA
jgi:hypothetical protein